MPEAQPGSEDVSVERWRLLGCQARRNMISSGPDRPRHELVASMGPCRPSLARTPETTKKIQMFVDPDLIENSVSAIGRTEINRRIIIRCPDSVVRIQHDAETITLSFCGGVERQSSSCEDLHQKLCVRQTVKKKTNFKENMLMFRDELLELREVRLA